MAIITEISKLENAALVGKKKKKDKHLSDFSFGLYARILTKLKFIKCKLKIFSHRTDRTWRTLAYSALLFTLSFPFEKHSCHKPS